ncbi:MAG: MotE family protein [Phaeospirillum sp.]|nr:MotE family protein [Phaeospirillum sp.]
MATKTRKQSKPPPPRNLKAANLPPITGAHDRAPPPTGKPPIVRLLPILIFVGVLMLSVRVTDIFKGIFGPGSVSVSELQAQQPAKPAPAPPPPTQAQPAATTPAKEPPPAATPASTSSGDANNGSMTQTELDVLQKLQERRGSLDVRERDIERREALLKAAEDQIDRKVAEMKTLQHTIEGLLRQYNDQEDNKMRSLVKIYENMKPKEAAKIFEKLEMSILLEVLERMKEQRVAPILAEMDPSKAQAVTSELAQRRQIPMPKAASGG